MQWETDDEWMVGFDAGLGRTPADAADALAVQTRIGAPWRQKVWDVQHDTERQRQVSIV